MPTPEDIIKLRKEVGYTFNQEAMKDTKGRFWTQGLFKEMSYGKPNRPCVLSLKNIDDGDKPSFKRIFVELADPSGYTAAMVLLGSWDHWLKLCDCTWFRPELARAIDELDVKLRSSAIIEIKNISEGSSGQALQAAKYLAEGKWKNKNQTSNRIGRPKKETTPNAKAKEAKVISIAQEETESDYERLGLGEVNTICS